jgi:hypothetical protein
MKIENKRTNERQKRETHTGCYPTESIGFRIIFSTQTLDFREVFLHSLTISGLHSLTNSDTFNSDDDRDSKKDHTLWLSKGMTHWKEIVRELSPGIWYDSYTRLKWGRILQRHSTKREQNTERINERDKYERDGKDHTLILFCERKTNE